MRINLFSLIEGISKTVDLVNPKLFSHHRDVALISYYLAEELNVSNVDKRRIIMSAMLHDIGAFNLKTRLKTLKFEERDVLEHAKKGSNLLGSCSLFASLKDIVLHHHTDWEKRTVIDNKKDFWLSNIINVADRFSVLVDKEKIGINRKFVINTIKENSPFRFAKEICEALEIITEKDIFWYQLRDRNYNFGQKEILDCITVAEKNDITALSELVSSITDFRSRFTATHSATIARVATFIAEKMNGKDDSAIEIVKLSGYFHDIGKLAIPNELIEKKGALLPEEFFIVKSHIYHTYNLLKDIKGLEEVTDIASRHHERLDGSGYPFRLSEKELTVNERIMAVCDVFVALKENRPYRKGMCNEEIKKIMNNLVKFNKLDGDIVGFLNKNLDSLNDIFIQQSKKCLQMYKTTV
ncbi:MAG: HD domain-containing protein [bacterium]